MPVAVFGLAVLLMRGAFAHSGELGPARIAPWALLVAAGVWAAARGLLEIYTWTQTGNEAMQRLNEKLGYRSRMISITVRGPIPARR